MDGREASADLVDLEAGAGAVTIVLTDTPTEVSGVVRDEKGAADLDAGVVAFAVDREGWSNYGTSPRRLRYLRPNRAGVYRVTGLPPGEYYFAAIDDAAAGNWQDPRMLDAISRRAERVVLAHGEKKSQDLVTRSVR
jgi:hypothetical protein